MSKIIPNPYKGNKPHIFVSYAHKDEEDVYPIIERLLIDGYRVWHDKGIEPAANWEQFISEKIESCEYMLCVVSKAYIQSENCDDELKFAITKSKKSIRIK